MILHRDLDPGIQTTGAIALEHFHRVCNARFYPSLGLPVIPGAQNDAEGG